MSSLRKNIVFLVGMQGINYLVPLIILPYLVRVLGPKDYGVLSFSMTTIQYIVLFTDFGFGLSSARDISKNKLNKNYINKIFSETIYIKILFSLISFFIIFLLISYNKTFYDAKNVLFCGFFYVIGSIFTPIWLFQGLEKVSTFSLISSVFKLLTIPLVFIFVKSTKDADIAILIQGLVFFATAIVAILYIFTRFQIRFIPVTIPNLIKTMKNSGILFIGTVTISLYTLSSPLILGLESTMTEVGIFSAANKLVYVIIGVFLATSGALYPRINSLFSENKDKGFYFIKRLLKYMIPTLLLMSVVFYFLATPVAIILLGHQYASSEILIKIMSPLIFFIPISVVLANYLLLPLGDDKLFSRIPIITLILHLSYIFILCKWYGAIGASIAIILTEVFSTSILLIFNIRKGYIRKVLIAHE